MLLDKIYIINLRTSPDRLKYIKQHLDDMKIPKDLIEYVIVDRPTEQEIRPSFLPNTDPALRTGKYGCCTSHLRILQDIKKNNYKYALVLEDDIRILDKNIVELVDKYITQLNDNNVKFDVLYIGGMCKSRSPKKISDNVYKTLSMNGTFAYVISQNATKLIHAIEHLTLEIDIGFRRFAKTNEFYTVVPYLVEPVPWIKSDITGQSGCTSAAITYSYKVLTGLAQLPEHKLLECFI